MSTAALIEQRVAQLRAKVEGNRELPDQIRIKDVVLTRRERYALRRYTRQLDSTARKAAGDQEVLYLDPRLARSMAVRGLVTLSGDRRPADMLFDGLGRVVWRNAHGPQVPATHVAATPTDAAKRLMDPLLRMKGD